MGCLYKATSPSGKSYIGISLKTMQQRWAKHIEHALGKRDAGAIYNAMRKYGPENFTLELLAECDDWASLCQMEIAAIQSHGTFAPKGYNITLGGEGTQGPMSEEARQRVSIAQKKRFQDPIQRAKLAELGNRARAASAKKRAENPRPPKPKKPPMDKEEWLRRFHAAIARPEVKARAKIAAIARATNLDKEYHSARTREGMAMPEVHAKVIACAAARAANPEWRKKIGDAKRGKKTRPASAERKALIAEARRREWADPEMRVKRLAALAKAREAKKLKQ